MRKSGLYVDDTKPGEETVTKCSDKSSKHHQNGHTFSRVVVKHYWYPHKFTLERQGFSTVGGYKAIESSLMAGSVANI